MANAIKVDGLRDLERAFTAADKALRTDLHDALAEAAAPVRTDAQRLAGTITNMTTNRETDWTRMRIGVRSSVVFVAPVERGSKARGDSRKRRRKFKDVLGPRMDNALDLNRGRVERRLDQMLGEVKAVWERYG